MRKQASRLLEPDQKPSEKEKVWHASPCQTPCESPWKGDQLGNTHLGHTGFVVYKKIFFGIMN